MLCSLVLSPVATSLHLSVEAKDDAIVTEVQAAIKAVLKFENEKEGDVTVEALQKKK